MLKYNYINYINIFLLLILFSGCGASNKVVYSPEELTAFRSLVAGKSFDVQSDWAFPLMTQGLSQLADTGLFMPGSNASRIDLIGNPNHLKVLGDSIAVNLPFFGERRMGGGYGNQDNGIRFEGIPERYTETWEEKKGRSHIAITFKQNTETLQLDLWLFPGGNAQINVNSTHRTSIRYSGHLKFEE